LYGSSARCSGVLAISSKSDFAHFGQCACSVGASFTAGRIFGCWGGGRWPESCVCLVGPLSLIRRNFPFNLKSSMTNPLTNISGCASGVLARHPHGPVSDDGGMAALQGPAPSLESASRHARYSPEEVADSRQPTELSEVSKVLVPSQHGAFPARRSGSQCPTGRRSVFASSHRKTAGRSIVVGSTASTLVRP